MNAPLDMESADLLRQMNLGQAVGAAQMRTLSLLGSPLPQRIAAGEAMCAALDALLAHEHAMGVDLHGTMNMVINEYTVLGSLLTADGRLPAARERFKQVLALAGQHGDVAQRANAAADYAYLVAQDGAPARAMNLLFDADDSLSREPPAAQFIDPVLRVGIALASFFRWLGDFDRCAAQLERVQQRAAELGRSGHVDLVNEAMMLAIDRAEFDAPDTADLRAAWLDQAQALLDALMPRYPSSVPEAVSAMRFQQVRIHVLRGDPRRGLALLEQLLPTFEHGPILRQKLGTVRIHHSRLLSTAGRHEEAVRQAETGVELERRYGQSDTLWRAHAQLARASLAAGRDRSQVLAAFDDAIEALDGIRSSTLGFRLDNLALRPARGLVDEAVAYAAVAGDANRAARYADAIKSRFLGLALARGIAPQPDPQDAASLETLSARIDAIAVPGLATGELALLVSQRAALVERMRLRANEQGEGPGRCVEPAAVLPGLALRDQAVLQLYLAGNAMTVVLLQAGGMQVGTQLLSDRTLQALQRYERNLLISPPHDQFSPLYDPAELGLSALDFIPAPLLEAACSARSLVVCPHGGLHLLPWPAMPMKRGRLFQRLPVATLPNLTCVEVLGRRPLSNGRLALIGAPTPAMPSHALPASDAEIEAIAALYGEGTLLSAPCRGAGATLDAFRQLIARDDAQGAALHVACHGLFEPDDPAGAALLLGDRLLTAAEIALRPLRFTEVSLSACSTGFRPTVVADVDMLGDDLLGLPASFLEAGASGVLNNLTPTLNSASAALLTTFHGRRAAGDPPLTAFALAQRALLEDRRFEITDWIGFSWIGVH